MPYHELAAFGFCGIAGLLTILWIVLGIWVYRDAGKRGMSGILWFLIVFFLGIIGLIIYFVVRKPIVQPMYPVQPGYAPPGAYGPPGAYAPQPYQQPPMAPMQPPMMGARCRHCGAALAAGSTFCSNCGKTQ